MSKAVLALFGLGLLALVVGVGFGTIAGDMQEDHTTVYFQTEGQTDYPSDTLTVVLSDKELAESDEEPHTANYTMIDTDTSQRLTETAAEGETITFEMQDDVQVTPEVIDEENEEVRTVVEHPRTYGWDESATTIAENFPFVMILAGSFSIIGGMIAVGVRDL